MAIIDQVDDVISKKDNPDDQATAIKSLSTLASTNWEQIKDPNKIIKINQ